MVYLATYLSLICFAVLWIRKDSWWLEDVFAIYGRGFTLAWQSDGRWSVLASAGWRLLLLIALTCCSLGLAFTVYSINPLGMSAILSVIVFVIMSAAGASIIPAFWMNKWYNFSRNIRDAATRLAPYTLNWPSFGVEPAGYSVEPTWTSWHPTESEYNNSLVWKEIVPVIYQCGADLVFPFDWKTFLVWGRPQSFAIPKEMLPFCGPGKTFFKVEKIRLLRNTKWWIVQAEMQFDDDSESDDRV